MAKSQRTQFGLLTVEEVFATEEGVYCRCRCRCGGERTVKRTSLQNGGVTACGLCVDTGVAPAARRFRRQVTVSVDEDVWRRLGLDPVATTGAELRAWLRELAEKRRPQRE
jgi:hypothetical protein